MLSLNSSSETHAMSDTYETNRDRFQEFRTHLPYAEGATGLAVAIGSTIVAPRLVRQAVHLPQDLGPPAFRVRHGCPGGTPGQATTGTGRSQCARAKAGSGRLARVSGRRRGPRVPHRRRPQDSRLGPDICDLHASRQRGGGLEVSKLRSVAVCCARKTRGGRYRRVLAELGSRRSSGRFQTVDHQDRLLGEWATLSRSRGWESHPFNDQESRPFARITPLRKTRSPARIKLQQPSKATTDRVAPEIVIPSRNDLGR